MAKIDTSIITKFDLLQKKLPLVLDAYGISQKHVYEKIGMSRSTWTRKLKNRSFAVSEMLDIAKVLNR